MKLDKKDKKQNGTGYSKRMEQDRIIKSLLIYTYINI